MKKIINLAIIVMLSIVVLTGCGNEKKTDDNMDIDNNTNVSSGEGVKVNDNKGVGSNNIINTVTFEAETYALFFNVYDMNNSPVEMGITMNYNELGKVISMTTKMNYLIEDGAQGFVDMINSENSSFSKIFSDINVIQEENGSYLTANLDITYNNYTQDINLFKTYDNITKWITDSKKNIDSDQSLYDSYEEEKNYYKENYIGYTIRFIK